MVNRDARPGSSSPVNITQLTEELSALIEAAVSEAIWETPPFDKTPEVLRSIRDLAFSGDGEPTACPYFPEALQAVLKMREAHGLSCSVVVLTNGTTLHVPRIQTALAELPTACGVLWVKLDAGDATHYQQINRASFAYDKLIDNIVSLGSRRPIVIQTMLLRTDDQPPSDAMFVQYLDRLEQLLDRGCKIHAVQLYTLARDPAQAGDEALTPLSDAEVLGYTCAARHRFPGLAIEGFGSRG